MLKYAQMFTLGLFFAAATINTAAELARATERFEPADRKFDITVQITQTPYFLRGLFFAADKTGSIMLHTFPGDWRDLRPGDVFRFKGHTNRLANRSGLIHADCDEAEFIRHQSQILTPQPMFIVLEGGGHGALRWNHSHAIGNMSSVPITDLQ